MRAIKIFTLLILMLLIYTFSYSQTNTPTSPFNYVLSKSIVPFQSIPRPAKGASVLEQFGNYITRVTDYTIDGYRMKDPGSVPNGTGIGYSNVSNSNRNDTYFWSQGWVGDFNIWYGPEYPNVSKRFQMLPINFKAASGQQANPGRLPFSPGTGGNWDATTDILHWSMTPGEEAVIYYTSARSKQCKFEGATLRKYNVETGVDSIVHDFSKDALTSKWFTGANAVPNGTSLGHYVSLGEYNETDIAQRYWGIQIREYLSTSNTTYPVAICVYDKVLDKVIAYTEDPTKTWLGPGTAGKILELSISPSGKYIFVRQPPDTGGNTIFSAYLISSNFTTMVAKVHGGHKDTALDAEGRDVVVGVNWEAYPPEGFGQDAIAWLDFDEPALYFAITQSPSSQYSGMEFAGHCYVKPGWILYGTYTNEAAQGGWDGSQLIMLELDRRKAQYKIPFVNGVPGPMQTLSPSSLIRVWRAGYHHVRDESYGGGYQTIPMANISTSGKYIFYFGAWETQTNNDPTEIYMMTLPATWWTDLSRLTSTSHPPSPPTGLKIIH